MSYADKVPVFGSGKSSTRKESRSDGSDDWDSAPSERGSLTRTRVGPENPTLSS